MQELPCPRCKTDQRSHWKDSPDLDLEGRDWYCAQCHAYLMFLNGRVSVVSVVPPQHE